MPLPYRPGRAVTLGLKEMTREARHGNAREGLEADLELLEHQRPRTRADCEGGERPCPFVSCRHNLFLDVNPETGSVKMNFPGKELWEIEHSCALDIAELGGRTLEEVGSLMNLTRERIRQLEIQAEEHARAKVER
jgi:hypothetical protein